MRLIDADALKKYIGCADAVKYGNKTAEQQHNSYQTIMMYELADYIDDMEEVDAEPVRHGEWIVERVDANQTKFYCSECERRVLCGNDYFMKPTKHVANIYPYCHCGAKMDGGKQDAD